MCPMCMGSAMMSAFFAAIACRHTGSPQDIKNVYLLIHVSEVLGKPAITDKFAHAMRRHLQLARVIAVFEIS